MRLGDVKTFSDKEKLYQLVNLRRNGMSLTSLALFFDCHHTSIMTVCKKYSINPLTEEIYTVERIVPPTFPKIDERWVMIDGERLNRGRNYADYFA